MVGRYSLITVPVAVATVLLVGCTSSTSGSGSAGASSTATPPSTSTSTGPSSASAPASSSAPSTPTVSASTVRAASTPLCLNDIRVIPQGGQGAAGHVSLILVFNNVSRTSTCEIIGYPGVDLVTASGATVVHLQRTLRGTAGGEPAGVTAPRPVILRPGQSASALAEASDVPQGGVADCGSYGLLITVPNQYASVGGGTSMLPRCAAEIHPVVPGTTGGMN